MRWIGNNVEEKISERLSVNQVGCIKEIEIIHTSVILQNIIKNTKKMNKNIFFARIDKKYTFDNI